MKSILSFFTLALLFASCTTAYKSGQTPDDVYYSPARPQDEYVRTESRQSRYQYDEQNEDDRFLRMKVRNRRTWSDLDYYYSDPYAYNYYNRYNTFNSLYYNTPWNYYSSWNYYYNPYNNYYNHFNPYYYNPYGGGKVVVVNPRPPVYNRPRTFNMNVYNPPQNSNSYNPKQPAGSTRRVYRGNNNRSYDYNTNNNAGSDLRRSFGNNNNSTYQPSNTPTRSSSSSSTTPSSSPSRSSSNAPVRKF